MAKNIPCVGIIPESPRGRIRVVELVLSIWKEECEEDGPVRRVPFRASSLYLANLGGTGSDVGRGLWEGLVDRSMDRSRCP